MFSLVRALPSPASAGRLLRLVRLVHRYYGAVRLLRAVHVRPLRLMPSPDRSRSCRTRRTGDLPVLVHVVSQRARVLTTTQGRPVTRDYRHWSCCLPLRNRVGALIISFSKLNSPAHRYLCLRFDRHLAMPHRKTRGQDGFAISFPVGLFHSLQHAGLSRRTSGNAVFRPQRLENQARRGVAVSCWRDEEG